MVSQAGLQMTGRLSSPGRNGIKLIGGLLCALLLGAGTGCQNKTPDSGGGLVTNPVSGEPGRAPARRAQIKIDNRVYDFGRVEAGEVVAHRYKFRNEGQAPLIINNASASCGCTVADYPRQALAPGDTGSVKIEFNTTGKSGENSKIVTLLTNSDPAAVELEIRGIVLLPAGTHPGQR